MCDKVQLITWTSSVQLMNGYTGWREKKTKRAGGKETEMEGNRGCLNSYMSQRFIKCSCNSEDRYMY